jgi:hypothetical protein
MACGPRREHMIDPDNLWEEPNEDKTSSSESVCNEGLDATLLDDYAKVARKTIDACMNTVIIAKEDREIGAKAALIICGHLMKLKNGI